MIYSFEEISRKIDDGFKQHQKYFKGKPDELYLPVNYILSNGGKRLRPALVLMSCNLFAENPDEAIPTAMGIEVFHNFTLLHDDIMDKADMRRGNPTVHKKWNENIAILSGDAMLIIAYKLLSDLSILHLPAIMKLFNNTALHVCEGQQLDMNFETAENISVNDYLEMIRLKTSVLLAASCKAGAIIGNATEEDAKLLYGFGQNIGLAFQIKDDMLDAFGDPKVFGKKIGGDILADKKTFLLLKARELADHKQSNQLKSLIGNTKIDKNEKIERMLNLYESLDVQYHSEELINGYYSIAMELLDQLSVPSGNKTELIKLANTMMLREK